MKKHLLFFGLFGCGLAFGQQNQSRNTINTLSLPLAGPIAFQFDTGFIGQLQNGTSFTSLLPTDRWFSIG